RGGNESGRNRLRNSYKLRQMVALMCDIILDQERQCHRLVVADDADCLQALLGDRIDECRQKLMLRLPPAQQRLPRLASVAMDRYPIVLRIPRAGVAPLDGCQDEAMAII